MKKDLSTKTGMPIFSSLDIYSHYLKKVEFERAIHLPILLQYFEKLVHLQNINQIIFGDQSP